MNGPGFFRPRLILYRITRLLKCIPRIGDRDFAWKVRRRMRHVRNPLLVTLQDKYAVKAYAHSRGVNTAPLHHVTDDPETLPFSSLPRDCFIKATHGCGWNIRCLDSTPYLFLWGNTLIKQDGSFDQEIAAGSRLTPGECISLCRRWLTTCYSRREWAYTRIPPRIIVEETLTQRGPGDLKDYRFYTFDGAVRAISVGSPGYRRRVENAFFDPDWNEIQLTEYQERLPVPLPERPDTLGEMIGAAERLGHGLDFARIDLFDTVQGVVLGEMTMYPESGAYLSPTSCRRFNRWLGRQWVLNTGTVG